MWYAREGPTLSTTSCECAFTTLLHLYGTNTYCCSLQAKLFPWLITWQQLAMSLLGFSSGRSWEIRLVELGKGKVISWVMFKSSVDISIAFSNNTQKSKRWNYSFAYASMYLVVNQSPKPTATVRWSTEKTWKGKNEDNGGGIDLILIAAK